MKDAMTASQPALAIVHVVSAEAAVPCSNEPTPIQMTVPGVTVVWSVKPPVGPAEIATLVPPAAMTSVLFAVGVIAVGSIVVEVAVADAVRSVAPPPDHSITFATTAPTGTVMVIAVAGVPVTIPDHISVGT